MRSKRCVGNGKKYVQAQRKGQSYIPHAFGGLVSTSTILNETRGKTVSGGIRGFNAPLLSRKDLNSAEVEPIRVSGNPIPQAVEKNKRGSNSEHLRFGFIRDEDAPAVLCRLENSAKITDTPMSGPVVKKPQVFFAMLENTMEHGRYVPIVVPGLSTGPPNSTLSTSSTSVPQDFTIEDPTPGTAPIRSQSTRVRPVACPQKPSMQHWEAGRMICQNGSRNSLNI